MFSTECLLFLLMLIQLTVNNAFEVLSAVTVKSTTVFWDVMPWSPVEFTDISEERTASIFRVLLHCLETISFSEICELLPDYTVSHIKI
jgi:hypothetical protein